MPEQSPRLDIAKPLPPDEFSTAVIADNWQKVDNHPGIFICTSATRPSWGAPHAGMMIYETDRDLYWSWSGSEWRRTWSKDLLGESSSGNPAGFSVTGATLQTILNTEVDIPPSHRTIEINVSGYRIEGNAMPGFQIQRIQGGGDPVVVKNWWGPRVNTSPGSQAGTSRVIHDLVGGGPSSGSCTYRFLMQRVTFYGGTVVTLHAGGGTGNRVSLAVLEV